MVREHTAKSFGFTNQSGSNNLSAIFLYCIHWIYSIQHCNIAWPCQMHETVSGTKIIITSVSVYFKWRFIGKWMTSLSRYLVEFCWKKRYGKVLKAIIELLIATRKFTKTLQKCAKKIKQKQNLEEKVSNNRKLPHPLFKVMIQTSPLTEVRRNREKNEVWPVDGAINIGTWFLWLIWIWNEMINDYRK